MLTISVCNTILQYLGIDNTSVASIELQNYLDKYFKTKMRTSINIKFSFDKTFNNSKGDNKEIIKNDLYVKDAQIRDYHCKITAKAIGLMQLTTKPRIDIELIIPETLQKQFQQKEIINTYKELLNKYKGSKKRIKDIMHAILPKSKRLKSENCGNEDILKEIDAEIANDKANEHQAKKTCTDPQPDTNTQVFTLTKECCDNTLSTILKHKIPEQRAILENVSKTIKTLLSSLVTEHFSIFDIITLQKTSQAAVRIERIINTKYPEAKFRTVSDPNKFAINVGPNNFFIFSAPKDGEALCAVNVVHHYSGNKNISMQLNFYKIYNNIKLDNIILPRYTHRKTK